MISQVSGERLCGSCVSRLCRKVVPERGRPITNTGLRDLLGGDAGQALAVLGHLQPAAQHVVQVAPGDALALLVQLRLGVQRADQHAQRFAKVVAAPVGQAGGALGLGDHLSVIE